MNAVLRPRPAPTVHHRPMTAADLDAVLAIEVLAYSHPWTRGNFIDSLAAGYLAELRLDPSGALLGYWVALPGFEETHLLNLTVAPPQQRAGHGAAMLQRLVQAARARGDQALWLEVRPSNQAARALYQRAGFVEVGLRRGYYPADRLSREDAVVMRLALDDLPPPPGPGAADALV